LFRKIDVDAAPLPTPQKSVNNINPKKDKIVGVVNMNTIKFEDFTKLDIRVGTIKKVEEIEGADKLYKLEVEVGKDKKILVAGIKQFYKKEELKDKQVVVIINLKPRKMRGVESEGMILAAVSDDHSKVILISPDKKIDSGSKIQ
jgi:methionine--tRNA ligase beta chain